MQKVRPLPAALVDLLADPDIIRAQTLIKPGVAIGGDKRKLKRDYLAMFVAILFFNGPWHLNFLVPSLPGLKSL